MSLDEQWKRKHIGAYYIATIYAALGEKDQAFAWLEKAYADRTVFLKSLPRDGHLTFGPRFKDLLHRMNFPP